MEHYKAAVLFKNKKPLKIINIKTQKPKKYQVFVKILYSGFCSSQFGEIEGIKGKDKYLPHCLGHEACAKVVSFGPKVKKVKKNDLVVLHWMKSLGKDCGRIIYKSDNQNNTINSGKITTFSKYSMISENRLTKIPSKKYNLKILPLMGCSLSVALSTLEKILKVKTKKNILIIGSGALGIPMIHYCNKLLLSNIDILEKKQKALKKSKRFGATNCYSSYNNVDLVKKLRRNFYHYIVDTTGSAKVLSKIFNYNLICKVALLGVPKLNEKMKINTLKINYGLQLLGSYGGNFKPQKDLVKYLNYLIKTKFNFKDYIDRIYLFKNINKLISDYKKNKIIGKAIIKVS